MAMVCKQIQEWIEEKIEKPFKKWENQQKRKCKHEDCNWWILCLNKLFCWLAWVLVKVVRWVLVTVGKWVGRAVCEAVGAILDIVAVIVHLILSIPVIGGILRTVLNWLTEGLWRIVGLIDFGLSLLGIRSEKRFLVGVIIPNRNGRPITTEAQILPQIEKAKEIYKRLCNVKIVYAGACSPAIDAPSDALNIGCDASGFFSDWWVGGSYIEFVSATCASSDGLRRVLGYGAEIIVFYVIDVTPDTPSDTVGCSFASTHNYVVVEPTSGPAVAAHEMGHACWLWHVDDPNNLMVSHDQVTNPTLTNLQISLVRWSKHCVYF